MGVHKNIQTPDILLQYFKEYQQYCKDNPILKEDYVGKNADKVYRELERPLSWVGFESFLYNQEIVYDLRDYENNKDGRYEDFAPIITRIKSWIKTDQFEGATVGIYKENIISRMLGLVDKVEAKNENTNTNKETIELTDNQFDKLVDAARQNAIKAD